MPASCMHSHCQTPSMSLLCTPLLRLLPAIGISCQLLLAGCASDDSGTPPATTASAEAPLHTGVLTDFSGHWEKNYQLSDDFNTRFQLYVADIQRRYTRNSVETTGFSPAVGVDAEAINGLARFAEEITRMPILDIIQNETGIDITREGDFNLRCAYGDRAWVQGTNAFGSDVCGWNRDQLVFTMQLAGGLGINHRLTLSPDGAELNVTTTVSSDRVAVPVVISNYYTRFNRPDDNYNCELTLTRNRVCTQRGSSE